MKKLSINQLPISLLVYGDSNEGGLNKRTHWRAKARIVERWRERTRLMILEQIGHREWFAERVRITFTLYRGRALDPDNAASSLCTKAIVDELRSRFFPDDSSKHVSYGPIQQVTGKQYARQPAVGVLIEDCAGPAGLEPEKASRGPWDGAEV